MQKITPFLTFSVEAEEATMRMTKIDIADLQRACDAN